MSSEEPGHQHVGGEDFGHDSEKTGTRMSLHEAAAVGDLEALKQGIAKDPSSVNAPDENLWTPLHEAARSDRSRRSSSSWSTARTSGTPY